MSILTRLRADRRTSMSTAVVLAFSGGIALAAMLYDGEATASVDLNDSGVWVTKESSGLVGRFNTEAKALDGTLLAGSASFDVQQQAGDVLVVDKGNSSVSVVDVARLKYASTTVLPAGAQVASGGGGVAILDPEDGRLWTTTIDALPGFDAEETDPTLELDAVADVAVSQGGTTFAVVPETDELWTLAPGAEPTSTALDGLLDEGDDVVLTTVGDDVVVLDRTGAQLRLPGGDVVTVTDAQGARLQQPGRATDAVAYATTSSLVVQPLDGSSATTRRASGTPSAPVQLGGCLYGAWSGSGQILRDCAGTDADLDRTLDGIEPDTRLEYRVNRNAVVLNDLSAGTLWMALDEYEKVDDWDVQRPEEGDGEDENADDDTPELVDNTVVDRERQDPPEANDDSFGARPGRATVLDVLANDLDPDGDVITAGFDGDQPDEMTVQEVLGGKALQAVVPEDATGRADFTYTVSDGRGGEATADVAVKIVPWEENTAPEQTGEPVLKVQQGGAAEIRVLPFFRDPDGDDVYLATASSTVKGDEVRAYPDGLVEFQDDGSASGRKKVDLVVVDSLGEAVEGTLWVDVIADSPEPPIAVGDHVVVPAGEPVTVEPLKNDSDPNGDTLRLASVSEAAPAEITPNYDAGTFTFVASEPKSYDILYQVSDGPGSTTGVIRVDVVDPDEADGPPVVVADTGLLPAGGSTLVDVLANDVDPAGRVLVVQSVEVPDDAGVTVAVLGHQMLKVTESKRISEPVVMEYTVTNGEESATGQVRVLPVPAPEELHPPHAVPDEVTVHAGDYVNIPVLANDTHPDGLELILDDELEQGVDPSLGEVFVAEDVLRFRAGAEDGTAYAIYKVEDPNGQEDSAQVTIHIRGGEDNAAPVPRDVAARVISGGTVRVQVPVDGIDPDGDSVRLLNVVRPPTKGIAKIVEGRYIDFRATQGVFGQDTLAYAVQDSRGQTAVGTIRIGIAEPGAKNHPPVVEDDVVTVRPERRVAVPALRNDSDPDGDQIGLVPGALEAEPPIDPEVVADRIVLETPDDEGTYSFYYAVEDFWGARAMGTVSVEVAEDAPLLAPVARDDVVLPDDVTPEMTEVSITALANDEDPDGAAEELAVTVDGSTATVDEDGVVTVELTTQRQLLTYTVTDQDGLSAKAFLQVPPLHEAAEAAPRPEEEQEHEDVGPAPRLKDSFVALEVLSGETLTIDLTDAVVVAEGGTAAIADAGSVSAAAGRATIVDAQHLSFVSDPDYVGPAAVSVQVTDGLKDAQGNPRSALIQIPVTVLPPENLPPEPGSPSGQVAAGEESTVDLSRYATDPNPDDDLTFALGAVPEGLSASVTGGVVALQAEPEVGKGSSFTIPFTVSDGVNPPVDGSLAVDVVASTRPLPRANPDTVEGAHQGVAVTVPVLENDVDPFAPEGLEIVAVAVETGSGEATFDGADTVVVSPAGDFVGTMVVVYRVQDVTKDVDRQVEGRITLTVLGVPEAPPTPLVEEVRSETVVLSWTPPVNNGAEITGYTVTSSQGDTFECATTTCTLEGLTNNVTYTFTVVATNEVGPSPASPPSLEARPDEKPDPPAAPTLVFGDGSLEITWENATYTDRSPIQLVNLEISPALPTGETQKVGLTGNRIVWEGLENGTPYRVRVQAENLAPDPSEWGAWSATEIPAGVPDAPAAPTAKRVETPLGGQVDVTWSAPYENGDTIKNYSVDVYQDGTKVQTVETTTPSYSFTGLATRSSYTFDVKAENKAGWGATGARSAGVTPYGRPLAPTGVSAAITSGDVRVTWDAADGNGSPVTGYTVTASNGATQSTGGGRTVTFTNLPDGRNVTFTVTATNAGGTSPASSASNGVSPFSAPGRPSASWTRTSNTDGYFTVSNPGSWNGQTGRVEWQLRGSQSTDGTGTGRVGVAGGYGKSYTLNARACNDAGCSSWDATGGATAATPVVTVSDSGIRANYDVGAECNNSTACTRLRVNASSTFPSGSYTFTCMSDFNGLGSFGTPRSFYLQAGGSVDLYCVLGITHGAQVWVQINGSEDWVQRTRWPK